MVFVVYHWRDCFPIVLRFGSLSNEMFTPCMFVHIKLSEFLTAEIYLLRVREEFCQLALKFLNRQLVKTLEFLRCLDWLLHRTFIIVFVFNQVALVRFARHLFHCSFATSFWTNNHGVFFRSLGMESPSNELVLIAVQDLS